MTLARAVAESLATVRTRIRDEISDPVVDFEGNPIPPGALRYTDAMVDRAINDALIEMQVLMYAQHPGEAINETAEIDVDSDNGIDINLTDAPVNLPNDTLVYAVYSVPQSSANNALRQLEYVSPEEIERYYRRSIGNTQFRTQKYTIHSNEEGHQMLRIRPVPRSGERYKVKYIQNPLIIDPDDTEGTELHMLAVRWREFLGLGAAIKLLDRDDEVSVQMLQRYTTKQSEFRRFSRRRAGRASYHNRRRMRAP